MWKQFLILSRHVRMHFLSCVFGLCIVAYAFSLMHVCLCIVGSACLFMPSFLMPLQFRHFADAFLLVQLFCLCIRPFHMPLCLSTLHFGLRITTIKLDSLERGMS